MRARTPKRSGGEDGWCVRSLEGTGRGKRERGNVDGSESGGVSGQGEAKCMHCTRMTGERVSEGEACAREIRIQVFSNSKKLRLRTSDHWTNPIVQLHHLYSCGS